jgi:hypothetical protein
MSKVKVSRALTDVSKAVCHYWSRLQVQSVVLPKSNFDLDSVWTAFNGQTASSLLECRYILTSSETDGEKKRLGPRSSTWEERPLWKRSLTAKKSWPSSSNIANEANEATAWECQFNGEQEVALQHNRDETTGPSWAYRAENEARDNTNAWGAWGRKDGNNVDNAWGAWEHKDGGVFAGPEENKEIKEEESPYLVILIFFLVLFILSGILNRL